MYNIRGRRSGRTEAQVSGLAAIATAVAMAATVRGYEIKQTLTARSPVADEKPPEVMTVYLAGDRARLEHKESGEITIVRLREGEILEIDDLLGCYDRKLFRKLRKQRQMQNALLLEQIAGTPSHLERAELIENLQNGPEKWREIWKLPKGEARAALVKNYNLPDKPPRIEVRRTKEKKKVAGVDCQRWESTEDGEVADWAYLAARIRFDPRYYEFMEFVGWVGPELAEGLRRAKRLPLESVMHLHDGGTVEIETQSVTERDLDTALFEVPEGYKERKPKAGIN